MAGTAGALAGAFPLPGVAGAAQDAPPGTVEIGRIAGID